LKDLVEFKGSPERDNLEVGLENPGSFPNMMNFLNFKNVMKWKIQKKKTFSNILEI
jgi:hypothetical protein